MTDDPGPSVPRRGARYRDLGRTSSDAESDAESDARTLLTPQDHPGSTSGSAQSGGSGGGCEELAAAAGGYRSCRRAPQQPQGAATDTGLTGPVASADRHLGLEEVVDFGGEGLGHVGVRDGRCAIAWLEAIVAE